MKRHQKRFAGIIILIVAISFWFFSGQKKPRKEINFPVANFSTDDFPKQSSPKINNFAPQEKYESSCYSVLLEKISANCSARCLIDYLRKENPDIAEYIAEGGFLGSTLDARPGVEKSKNNLIRFYFGMMNQKGNAYRIKMLSDLASDDKTNSYPALYLAGMLFEDGKKIEARTALIAALSRPAYKNYIVDYRKRLFLATIHDPALFSRAIQFNGAGFQNLAPFDIEAVAAANDDLQMATARKVLSEAIRNDGKNPEFAYSLVDARFGKEILDSADSRETSKLPDFSEIDNEYYHEVIFPQDRCAQKDFEEYRKRTKDALVGIK